MEIKRLVEFLSEKERFALVLRGINGSGKTRLCSQIEASFAEQGKKIVRISVDNYFSRGGKYLFDATRLNQAYDETFNQFLDSLDDPDIDLILVDNPNIRTHEISPYVTCASAFGVMNGVVTVHCDPQIACLRHGKKIQDSKIVDMHRELLAQEFPSRWHRFEVFNGATGSLL